MIEAELHDGRVLEFPDGTDPQVVQATVKKMLGTQQPSLTRDIVSGFQSANAARNELGTAFRHNLMKPFHNTANLVEQMGAGLALVAAPESQFAQKLGSIAMSDEEALAQAEKQYQQEVPDTAASYTGAVAGTIAPYLLSTVQKGLNAVGQAGGEIGKFAPQFMQKMATNAGNYGAQGLAIGAISTPSLEKMPESAGTGAATGVITGALAPKIFEYAAKGAGWAKDLLTRRLVDIKAGKILKDVADKELPQIQAALGIADDKLTSAQAAADVGSTKWSALGELAKKNDSQVQSQIAQRQAQEKIDDVARVAGGYTQTEAKQAAQSSNKALNQITTPMRETELGAANGLKPLDTNAVVSRITTRLNDPKVAPGNKAVTTALANVSDEIAAWTQKNGGIIDAEALYSIRKNSVNSTIDSLLGTADPKVKARVAAGVLNQINPIIDDAITQAGGTGWKAYLETHAQGMKIINQQKLGAKALELLNTNQKGFLKLVEGNNPKMVQKIFDSEYDIVKAMSDKYAPLDKVAQQIKMDIKLKDLADKGADDLANVLMKDSLRAKLPTWLNVKATVTNKALDIAEKTVNKKVMAQVYVAMRNGQDANKLMNTLSSAEKDAVLKAVKDGKFTKHLNYLLVRTMAQGASQ